MLLISKIHCKTEEKGNKDHQRSGETSVHGMTEQAVYSSSQQTALRKGRLAGQKVMRGMGEESKGAVVQCLFKSNRGIK